MKYFLIPLLILWSSFAVAQSLVITIDAELSETTLGWRVYKYTDGVKELVYEGQESQIKLPHTHSAIYSVVSYNEYAESEEVPRIATYTPPRPAPITWTMEVTITPPEVNNGQ